MMLAKRIESDIDETVELVLVQHLCLRQFISPVHAALGKPTLRNVASTLEVFHIQDRIKSFSQTPARTETLCVVLSYYKNGRVAV